MISDMALFIGALLFATVAVGLTVYGFIVAPLWVKALVASVLMAVFLLVMASMRTRE